MKLILRIVRPISKSSNQFAVFPTVKLQPMGTRTLDVHNRSRFTQRMFATAKVERPKARQETAEERQGNQYKVLATIAACLGGIGGIIGLASVATGRSPSELWTGIVDTFSGAPDVEVVSSILPPLDVYSDPDRGLPGVARGPVIVRRPTATLVVGWERVLVDIVYEPRTGYRTAPRPGLSDFLLACADANVEVVLWSGQCSAQGLEEQVRKVIHTAIVPEDKDRYSHFSNFVLETQQKSKVYEAAEAIREKRAPRPLIQVTEEDIPDLFRQHVLRIEGLAGKEHCFKGEKGSMSRDVELLTNARPADSVLALFTAEDAAAVLIQPESTCLTLPPFTATVTSKQALDPTLMLLSALVRQFEDACAAATRGPKPSISSLLSRLASEAVARGLQPKTGKAIDRTVGILGVVLAEEQRKLKEDKQSAEAKR